MRPVQRFLSRVVRAASIVVRDGRIPRPIRWAAGLGLLPVPGPFDEVVLLVLGVVLWLFYRDRLEAAWADAGVVREGRAWWGV